MNEPDHASWLLENCPVPPHSKEAPASDPTLLRIYLEQAGDVESAEVIEFLCIDQVERWRRGERIPAEAYLRLHDRLQGESSAAFELVYGEFMLREHLGESPSVSEYIWRFPQFTERLERQVQLHQALGADGAFDTDFDEGDASVRTSVGRPPAQSRTLQPPTPVPGYEVLGELGRGGMGVVYQARQLALNRVVALKVLRDGFLADAEEATRFRREAELAAQLQHPNIVQIFEVGEAEGRPYLALEYVEGGTLQQRLAGTPQAPRVAAELVETLARAMHHAHQRGIIHRDLKPANVLLVSGGVVSGEWSNSALSTPKITDFGLAKQLGASVGATATGAVLGTPSYMAPEQAAGRLEETSASTDVYALGTILYEMLTGRPPFHAATPLATMALVLSLDPLPPSRLQPGQPRDLETVCLQCLHKEPARRYGSAEELAADLHRFLNGEPVLARPTPAWERAWKWARRRPVVAGLSAALIVVTALAFGLVTWQWSRAEDRAQAEREARSDAQEKGRREKEARHEVERASAGLLLDQGYSLCLQGEVDRGLLTLVRALEQAERADAPDLQRVARFNIAAWRPQLIPCRARYEHKDLVMAAVFGPSARVVLTGSTDRTARLWEAETGRPLCEPLVHEHPVWCVALSPDGKYALTGGGDPQGAGEVRLWDGTNGKSLGSPLKLESLATAVLFSLDGKRFLTVSPREAQLWNTATLQTDGPPLRHAGAAVQTTVFSPDGKTILTGGSDNTARFWETESGKQLGEALPHRGAVLAAAFSPDGKRVLTGAADGVARLWNVASGKQQGLDMFHRGPVRAVAFRPDGEMLATGAVGLEPDPETRGARVISGEACLWQIDGRRILLPLVHPRPVWAVAFSPDSHLLLTGCEDGNARIFRVSSRTLVGRPLKHEGTVRTVAYSADGRRVLTSSAGGDKYAAARLWDIHPALDNSRPLPHKDRQARAIAYSPDGKTLLLGYDKATARFWDLARECETDVVLPHGHWVTMADFNADGSKVLTSCQDRKVRLWDRAAGKLLHSWEFGADTWHAHFSPDGQTVAIASTDGTLAFFDAASGRKHTSDLKHSTTLYGLGFAADSRSVWTVGDDDTIRRWDVSSGREIAHWPAPPSMWGAAFTPRGQAALCYRGGNYVQLRDLETGAEKGPVLSHGSEAARALTFSRDGLLLATAGYDQNTRLWDTATGKPMGPPFPHSHWVYQITFRPDGKELAVAGEFVSALWPVPATLSVTSRQARLWAELSAGARLDEWGSMHPLSLEELEQRRRDLNGAGGTPE